jgi:hypothetical protein
VDAVNLSLEVDYYKDCAETQPYYRKTFSNQIGIGGDGFSDSGDSGALIVDAANAEPLGLYFAGGTDGQGTGFSVASPIQDVLAELGAQAGRQFSVVGGGQHPVSCLNYGAHNAASGPLPESLRKKADSVARRNASVLINPANGILDLQSGASEDYPGNPAVAVYVDKNKSNVPVPQTLNGLRTLVIPVDQAQLLDGSAPKVPGAEEGIHLSQPVLEDAAKVQQVYAKRIMADPAIFGVGVAQSHDNPAEAALLILVDMARTPRAMPAVIGGLRTRYIFLHRFHVTKSRYAGAPHPSSCALKSMSLETDTSAFDPERTLALPLP